MEHKQKVFILGVVVTILGLIAGVLLAVAFEMKGYDFSWMFS